jgi:DNA mismatch repair protein MutL
VCVPIHVLSADVTAAIAAGEVVERPASVVKELVENALDAEARSVDIRVERGGKSLIEVADDGNGIPASEVALAVTRHATSKLVTKEELFAIRTLGFRGEALASIAAVAHLELVTRASGEATGMRLEVDGGRTGRAQPIGAPQGTIVRARDLFFNVPARLKFLKSEDNERRRIAALVTRYALAYPRVRFRLTQEGRLAFGTTGDGDQRGVLAEGFGPEVARQMLVLPETGEAPVRVTGFLSPPSVHRSNRRELTFFVNGRWVQDASLMAAVVQAYHGLLMVGRFPLAIIFLQVPPQAVDVNVHPAKAEVRFRDAEGVFTVVQRAVRATLLGQTAPPAVRLPQTWGVEPWHGGEGLTGFDWQVAHSGAADVDRRSVPELQPALPTERVPLLRAVGQVGASYLVAEGPDGLYLIDQHAAHERVLFEALTRARQDGTLEAQRLLDPVTVEVPRQKVPAMEAQLESLRRIGLEVEPFGGGAFRIRSMPAILGSASPAETLRSVVEDFEEDETPLEAQSEARLAARVCKRAAVKAGQVLSLAEQERLLRDLESCQAPRTCPHGRPTMIHLSVETLERQFGRRG